MYTFFKKMSNFIKWIKDFPNYFINLSKFEENLKLLNQYIDYFIQVGNLPSDHEKSTSEFIFLLSNNIPIEISGLKSLDDEEKKLFLILIKKLLDLSFYGIKKKNSQLISIVIILLNKTNDIFKYNIDLYNIIKTYLLKTKIFHNIIKYFDDNIESEFIISLARALSIFDDYYTFDFEKYSLQLIELKS